MAEWAWALLGIGGPVVIAAVVWYWTCMSVGYVGHVEDDD